MKTSSERQIDDESESRTGEKIADVLELPDTSDRIANASGLKIADWQRQKMTEQTCAQLDVDAVGCVREQVCSKNAQYGFKQRNGHEADRKHIQVCSCCDGQGPCR